MSISVFVLAPERPGFEVAADLCRRGYLAMFATSREGRRALIRKADVVLRPVQSGDADEEHYERYARNLGRTVFYDVKSLLLIHPPAETASHVSRPGPQGPAASPSAEPTGLPAATPPKCGSADSWAGGELAVRGDPAQPGRDASPYGVSAGRVPQLPAKRNPAPPRAGASDGQPRRGIIGRALAKFLRFLRALFGGQPSR